MENKVFYKLCTIHDILNININMITEWSVTFGDRLTFSLLGGVTYQVPRFEDPQGYDALLKALEERTVGIDGKKEK